MDFLNDATILLVDDEPENLHEIESFCYNSNMSCKIIKSPNGEIALKCAREKRPDLIITDWDMPGMNGIELVEHLKSDIATQDIPIIMFTGIMILSENLQTALEAGAVDYIRKPLDKIELLARARTVLQLSDSLKELKKQKQELVEKNLELTRKQKELEDALENIKTLRGLIPICASCKKIRDDKGYWNQIELYLRKHADVQFTHGICPECKDELLKDFYRNLKSQKCVQ